MVRHTDGMKVIILGIVLLFALYLTIPDHVYGEGVAIAVPVEGIVLDGELGDWPEQVKRYPLRQHKGRKTLADQKEISSSFLPGYDTQENVLYIGPDPTLVSPAAI